MGGQDTSLTERLLRRDRWIVLGGLAAISLLSWTYILTGAGTGMSARSMTKAWLFPHRMAGTPFHPAGWTSAYWIIMLLMWWVMMIAMMTPSAAPMILLYARATRYAQCKDQLGRGIVPAAAFAGGYLLTWFGFSFFATLLFCNPTAKRARSIGRHIRDVDGVDKRGFVRSHSDPRGNLPAVSLEA